MTRIRLEAFKSWYGSGTLHDLYHRCLPVAMYDPAGQANRAVTIDESRIPGEAFRRQFAEFVAANPDAVLPMAQASYPELDVLQPQDAPLEPVKPKAPAQSRADIEATQQRYLSYWVAEQGLLNNPENAAIIDRWFAAHNATYSVAALDAAIEANRAALQWYVVPTVENIEGTREVRLPLGTRPSSKHSVRQLRDLDRREKEAKAAAQRKANTELAKQHR